MLNLITFICSENQYLNDINLKDLFQLVNYKYIEDKMSTMKLESVKENVLIHLIFKF